MKQDNILIRNAVKKDIPHIQHLLKETKLYWAPMDDYPRIYEAQLKHDPESIIIAECEQQIIGMVLFVYSPLWSPVGHLAVLPGFQRQGIGKLLFKRLIEIMKDRGTCDIVSYIEETNKASLAFCDSFELGAYSAKLVCRYKDFPQS